VAIQEYPGDVALSLTWDYSKADVVTTDRIQQDLKRNSQTYFSFITSVCFVGFLA
jgi:hypothetical protein